MEIKEYIFETSTVADGNMSPRYDTKGEVVLNLALFLERVHAPKERVALMHVVHEDSVRAVTAKDFTHTEEITCEAEALMTHDASISLVLFTADCLPVAYIDKENGCIALAHLGWRPAALGLATKVVDEMERAYGTYPSSLEVVIGPGIGKEFYAHDAVEQVGSEWALHILNGSDGKVRIDLKGFVKARLIERGVLPESISVHPSDTVTDGNYFSHYRSEKEGTPEGRQASVLSLHKANASLYGGVV